MGRKITEEKIFELIENQKETKRKENLQEFRNKFYDYLRKKGAIHFRKSQPQPLYQEIIKQIDKK